MFVSFPRSLLFLLAAIAALGSLGASVATALGPERLLEDEIIYVVIVEKFCNGDLTNDVMAGRFARRREHYEGGFWGGDLAGIRQKLDYFTELGVTALLLYPVVENDRNPVSRFLPTGYRPRNYFRVDENFGDLEQLKRLVGEAHGRGLRVILDMPLGMPGFEYSGLEQLRQQGWLGAHTRYGRPQWNAEQRETADFLIEVARFWRDQTGCDGMRLDSAQLHSTEFWTRFVRALKNGDEFADFLLLAELPLSPREIDATMHKAGFDGAYDFSAGVVRDVFGRGEPVGMLSWVLRDSQQRYRAPRSMLAQLDNYEDPTFVGAANDPKLRRMQMAMTFLLTLDRVPLIYPGDERAMSFRAVGDLFSADNRHAEFFERTKKLIALRKSEPALRRGRFVEVLAKPPIYSYLRSPGDDQILVVFNLAATRQPMQFDVEGKSWNQCRLDDLLSGDVVKLPGTDAAIQLDAFASHVFRVR